MMPLQKRGPKLPLILKNYQYSSTHLPSEMLGTPTIVYLDWYGCGLLNGTGQQIVCPILWLVHCNLLKGPWKTLLKVLIYWALCVFHRGILNWPTLLTTHNNLLSSSEYCKPPAYWEINFKSALKLFKKIDFLGFNSRNLFNNWMMF